jgi:hypothetical protein
VTGRADLRAADADRQAVADRLRRAHDEGRLGFADYDDRLGRAYAAVSYADLDGLVADLPAAPPPAPVAQPVVGTRPPAVLRVLWTVWACVFGVNLVVWTLVSLGNGVADHFWPMWLLVPGTVLLVLTVITRALRRR